MARTNNRGGNSAGFGGYSAFTKSSKSVPFTKTKASPYKFLKGLFGKGGGGGGGMNIGGVLGGIAAGPMGMLMGNKLAGGGGGGASAAAAQGVAANPVAAAAQQKAIVGGGGVGIGGMAPGAMTTPGMGRAPMMQRNEFEKRNSPMTATDRVLVEGAYDAASGKGTVKYGATAGARAWTDMVNTVEDTVNRSSRAMARKDRTRQKVHDKSFRKYGRWHKRRDWTDSREHGLSSPHGLNRGNPQLIN